MVTDIWKLIRIWILTSWSFLTIGILLGSWWAYHELGWGGWWFWDPVENASLMPWLLATACIHSITKPKLSFWTIICTQGTFLLSILGTFFVRSGVLASVHSFATDSTRGLYLFLFLILITVFSVFNWISLWRTSTQQIRDPLAPPSPSFQAITKYRSPNVKFKNYDAASTPSFLRSKFLFASNLNRRKFVALAKFTLPAFAPIAHSQTFSPKLIFPKAPESSSHSQLQTQYSQQRSEGKTKGETALKLQTTFSRCSNLSRIKRSIEQILYLQNFFFCVICLVVFCGTSSPIFYQWLWNRDVGTGAPFYNGTLIPLFTSVFFVLVYAHYLKFDILNKKAPQQCVLQASKNSYVSRLAGTLVGFNTLYGYCIFFFLLHVICLHFFIGLDFLNSIYGTFCFLLISSIWRSNKNPFGCLQSVFSFFSRKRKIASNRKTFGWYHIECEVRKRWRSIKKTKRLQVAPHFGYATDSKKQRSGAPQLSEMKIAHTGIVLFISGILLSNTFKFQFRSQLHSGSMIHLGSQICCLRSIDHSFAPTFHSICANLLVYQQPPFGCLQSDFDYLYNIKDESAMTRNLTQSQESAQFFCKQPKCDAGETKMAVAPMGRSNFQDVLSWPALCLFPEKRFYFSNQELTTTKVAIHSNLFTDIYGLIGTGSFETGWFTTIMRLPFIFCIWLGFLFGVIGGLFSLKKQVKKSKINWL